MRTAIIIATFTVLAVPTASAQTVLKREPHYLAPGAVVYVDDGRCTVGMVVKVTGVVKNWVRRKACVPFNARHASLD